MRRIEELALESSQDVVVELRSMAGHERPAILDRDVAIVGRHEGRAEEPEIHRSQEEERQGAAREEERGAAGAAACGSERQPERERHQEQHLREHRRSDPEARCAHSLPEEDQDTDGQDERREQIGRQVVDVSAHESPEDQGAHGAGRGAGGRIPAGQREHRPGERGQDQEVEGQESRQPEKEERREHRHRHQERMLRIPGTVRPEGDLPPMDQEAAGQLVAEI